MGETRKERRREEGEWKMESRQEREWKMSELQETIMTRGEGRSRVALQLVLRRTLLRFTAD